MPGEFWVLWLLICKDIFHTIVINNIIHILCVPVLCCYTIMLIYCCSYFNCCGSWWSWVIVFVLFEAYQSPCWAHAGYIGTDKSLLMWHDPLLFWNIARDLLHVVSHKHDTRNTFDEPAGDPGWSKLWHADSKWFLKQTEQSWCKPSMFWSLICMYKCSATCPTLKVNSNNIS